MPTCFVNKLTVIYQDLIWQSFLEEILLPSTESGHKDHPFAKVAEMGAGCREGQAHLRAAGINPYKLTKSGCIGRRDLSRANPFRGSPSFSLLELKEKKFFSRCAFLDRHAYTREYTFYRFMRNELT